MSPNKTARLGRGAYQRPSADVLDDLTDPGTSESSVTLDVVGNEVPSATLGPSGTTGFLGSTGNYGRKDVSDTIGGSGYEGTSANLGTKGTSDISGSSGARAAKPPATPRDHVKVARPLTDEMRDAVWFLSEHGRPRVQLGELLDEAIVAWLGTAKAKYNEGEPFPVRGRLR